MTVVSKLYWEMKTVLKSILTGESGLKTILISDSCLKNKLTTDHIFMNDSENDNLMILTFTTLPLKVTI